MDAQGLRRLTPDRVRQSRRLRAAALRAGLIPPRTMHTDAESALLADWRRTVAASWRSACTRARRRSCSWEALPRDAELHLIEPFPGAVPGRA